jgi:hypothetical protein
VAAIAYPDVSNLQVAGGYLVLAGLFVLMEITSGALQKPAKSCGRGRETVARHAIVTVAEGG